MKAFASTQLYEVWLSRGDGTFPGPKFRHLADARRYADEHRREASVAVKAPDGKWIAIGSRRRVARGTFR